MDSTDKENIKMEPGMDENNKIYASKLDAICIKNMKALSVPPEAEILLEEFEVTATYKNGDEKLIKPYWQCDAGIIGDVIYIAPSAFGVYKLTAKYIENGVSAQTDLKIIIRDKDKYRNIKTKNKLSISNFLIILFMIILIAFIFCGAAIYRTYPVMAAAMSGCAILSLLTFVSFLVACGNRFAPSNSSLTPLQKVAFKNDIENAKFLISRGIPVDETGAGLFTPLHVAAANNHTQMIEFLIESGADVNAQNKYGVAPIHSAAFKNNADALTLLIENGADIMIKNINGSSPLHAAAFGDAVTAADILLKIMYKHTLLYLLRETIDTIDTFGQTPLHIAGEANNKKMAEFLINRNADKNKVANDGNTPLRTAFGRFSFKTAMAIKKAGGKWS